MRVLVCGTCHNIIRQYEPFWQAYYSKKVFCSASCAAIAQGYTRYTSGESYNRIFIERSIDEKTWDTIRSNLDDNPTLAEAVDELIIWYQIARGDMK